MYNTTTPIHNIHSTIVCSCPQCEQERNAVTGLLPRFDRPTPTEGIIAEIVTAINAETGEKVTYYWPIPRKY